MSAVEVQTGLINGSVDRFALLDWLQPNCEPDRVALLYPKSKGSLSPGWVMGKADAVLAASIFHFRTYTISQAKSYLRDRGVPVRVDVLSGVA